MTQNAHTVVIGGGQAGLAVGYHLAKQGRELTILDANERIGDSWRNRWDSLRLFTPAHYDGLPGWRFPAPGWSFPTKDEMADYLEAYARRFELPVQTGVRVERLAKEGGRFLIAAGDRHFEADRVVVASGAHIVPRAPGFATELGRQIRQLHSSEYRDPSQLQDGSALVVGAGNSGAEIALELSGARQTMLAGRAIAEIPVPHGGRRARLLLPVLRFLGNHLLTVRTPIGRKVGPQIAHGATPLIRTKSADLEAAGVERVPRVAGVRDGLPLLEDGQAVDAANVVWCTGFRQDFSWIELPVLDENGEPVHDRGVARGEPALCFMGLLFQYAVTSDVLPGVSRDAKRIARHLARLDAEASIKPERGAGDRALTDLAREPA
jgi:putative flavoprotein involved in K+ transport